MVICRGIPASGKTTWAKKWVDAEPSRRARINRDDLRMLVFGRPAPLSQEEESIISAAQVGAVTNLLKAGKSVVVDDTHIPLSRVKDWWKIAVVQ